MLCIAINSRVFTLKQREHLLFILNMFKGFCCPFSTLFFTLFVTSFFSALSLAQSDTVSDINQSIAHFRVHPIYVAEQERLSTVDSSVQDKDGYLWMSNDKNIFKYDGFRLHHITKTSPNQAVDFVNAKLFIDSEGQLWVADKGLYRLNSATQSFEFLNISDSQTITSISEDKEGYLWIAGPNFGLYMLNKKDLSVKFSINTQIDSNFPSYIFSTAYDKTNNRIWMVSNEGVSAFDINTSRLTKISSSLDGYWTTFFIRNISFDSQKNTLWVGTTKGLLRVNGDTLVSKLYTANSHPGSLPINYVTTTFLDNNKQLWLGLDKAGLCLFKYASDSFLCVKPAFNEKYKFPIAAIDNISEDNNGNLWLSVTGYGLYRLNPSLEKFRSMQSLFTQAEPEYFPHSFEGIVRENGDIWIASDGGGINIFNYKSGKFRTIKHETNNPDTIASNSVISIIEDENDDIWIGTWAGGLSRIDAETQEVQNFLHNPRLAPNKTIAGDNIFALQSDRNGGIWIGVWGFGVQYYDTKKDEFTQFFNTSDDSSLVSYSHEINNISLYDDKLFVAGEEGLEYLDIKTGKFTNIYQSEGNSGIYVLVESLEEIWLGTNNGLVLVNALTKEFTTYTEEQGLVFNAINYLKKIDDNIWVATKKGLSIFDTKTLRFTNFYERDGLLSDITSGHGKFIEVDQQLYMPTKFGVNIINPKDIPFNSFVPKTVFSNISIINPDNKNGKGTTKLHLAPDDIQLPHTANSLLFEIASLSFVHPQYNQFKYRLVGWQDDFEMLNPQERSVRYTNIPPGTYSFEVYSSNSSGVWDEQGAKYSFTILSPWWLSWWAYLLYIFLLISFITTAVNWRLAINVAREKELQAKVDEKTKQMAEYAEKLKQTGNSLTQLNAELEERVAIRTNELQVEVDERKSAETKLYHIAFHDSLTGLANREWIIHLIQKLLKRCKQETNFRFAVMFLDGDRFKQVNDTHGHLFGDKLLLECSRRLKQLLGDGQQAGRLGGDEFTVIVENSEPEHLHKLAMSIVEAFRAPFYIESYTTSFNVSVGVVQCDDSYTKVPDILKHADIAMYRAKAAGRSTYRVFDNEMQEAIIDAVKIEEGLKQAIKDKHLFLMYQPLVSLQNGKLEGFEALVRWKDPEKGIISPEQFIHIAEETGLIWDLGKWVLEEACRQAFLWHQRNPENKVSISVNLSTNQLANVSFLDMLDGVLVKTGFDSSYLKLELTESVLIENKAEFNTLYDALYKRKIDLAIDDFGTGYSSLAYLNQIPVQYLKIDRYFIAAIDQNGKEDIDYKALKLVESTISLAKSLGKKVTAEGIETHAQLEYLISFACDLVQGYHLSKPLIEADASLLIEQSQIIDKAVIDNVLKING